MPQKLAHYQIEDLLGEGSFAWVYRAFDEKFERLVALKVLKPIWLSDLQAIARFKQEAKTMAQLRHANIVDVYDVGEAKGQIYLSQLLVEGETLADRLTHSLLPWDEVIKIITDIGSALDYAHGQGIIHRDIKPQNILLGKGVQAYLGDFGLVRAVEGSTRLSSTMSMVGTAHYMAPEVWDGEKAIPASDVYALSCVMFEMLTGKVLFEGSSMAAVAKQHIVGPQFPERWPENVPAGVTDVLQRGLAEDSADRVSSASELAAQLAALGVSAKPAPPPPVATSTEPIGPVPPPQGRAKSGPSWILLGWVAAVMMVIGIGFLLPNILKSLLSAPTLTPTEASPILQTNVAPSGQIVFNTLHGGIRDIYIVPVSSEEGSEIHLTANSTNDYGGTWSPDGQRIAFHASNEHLGDWRIWIFNAFGDRRKELGNTLTGDAWPSWSPSNNDLVFRYKTPEYGNQLFVTNLDTLERTQISDNVRQYDLPSWSPNGQLIATLSEPESTIYVMNKDGSNIRLIIDDVEKESRPNWSPDSTKLTFARKDGEIYIIDIHSFELTRVTDDPAQDLDPAWSPDGQWLTFVSDRDDNAYTQVYIMSIETDELKQLTYSSFDKQYPQWQPFR